MPDGEAVGGTLSKPDQVMLPTGIHDPIVERPTSFLGSVNGFIDSLKSAFSTLHQ